MRKITADDCADLRHFLDEREAVEPRHERIRAASSGSRGAAADPTARSGRRHHAIRPGLEHRPGKLLDEQRHAVGRVPRSASSTSAGKALPSVTRATIAAAWRRPRRLSDSAMTCGLTGPRRAELWSIGNDNKDRQATHPLDQHIEQLQCRRVAPVHVLVQREHGTAPARGRPAARSEPARSALLLPLRGSGASLGSARFWRHVEQRSDERHGFLQPSA